MAFLYLSPSYLFKNLKGFSRFISSTSTSTTNATFQLNEAEQLARLIKELQHNYEMTLPAQQPYVVRLDGVAFRNYTNGMRKPFDSRLTRAMLLTTRDLLERCSARTAFCQSDEISLVFPPEPTPNNIIYAGRVQKIVSVMASWASARFNWHISHMEWNEEEISDSVRQRIMDANAVFDARIFSTPNDMMATNALYWRHAFDGRRNAINMIGCKYFNSRQLHGMGLPELLHKLREEHNVDPFRDFAPTSVYGSFLKKKNFAHVGFNPQTGQSVATIRSRIEARAFDWRMDASSRAEMVMARVWEAEHPASLEFIDLEDK